ncbi:MAG: non-ribosomal peptide synthetase, partial [Blastocatellia bacterium]
NGRANQLARYLKRRGVRLESRVGVCADRSAVMVVGLLGVMKAGAAYVPLDPSYPKDRLLYMVKDAGLTLVLTQQRLIERLPEHDVEVICLENYEAFAGESDKDFDSGVGPSNLAYVLYTSGSTGRPKGVEVQHSSLVNLVSWHNRAYEITPADRASQVAGPSFDASVWETWPYLAAGASLHIPDAETRARPSELARWVAREGVTVCFLPTPLVEMVLDEPCLRGARLRLMVTGGDKLNQAEREGQGFALVNHYGPSENTVVATCARAVAMTGRQAAPTIGRPIANVQVYLLDGRLNPVPIGVTGELYIGGEGLARGYLNRPDTTAEKFIPNPFADSPGARLYRSGDLARYLADGNLEFVGRSDYQVKIRGFRIELGEIEFVLNAHAAVSEAVVVLREDAPGHKRLVAYAVPKPGRALTAGELRALLRESLPDYMVPSAFVILDALPLTANGKVDRDGLPAPDTSHPDPGKGFVAPAGELERAIAAIWQDTLRVGRVGRYDNFFDLGGHSLLMVEVHSRLREVMNRDLSIVELFKFPTVSSLAQHLSGGDEARTSARENQERGVSRRESIAQRARRGGQARSPRKDRP